MRNRYWSIGKFADWVRGTASPTALTATGWRRWREQAQAAHPIRYWIAEEALDKLQNLVMWPIDQIHSIKYYINNRWVTRTHACTAHPRDIRPGTWHDVGSRFVPCLFNELVDFVEVETAWHHIAWSKEAKEKYHAPFWSHGWFRWRTWRSAEAGVEHLEWAAGLTNSEYLDPSDPKYNDPTPQARAAREILDLYHWWTQERPARPDPHDASGWTAICDQRRARTGSSLGLLDDEDTTPAERRAVRRALDRCRQIENAYEREDERMLIRLIKIRNHLWT